jgi:hypothetical protein
MGNIDGLARGYYNYYRLVKSSKILNIYQLTNQKYKIISMMVITFLKKGHFGSALAWFTKYLIM